MLESLISTLFPLYPPFPTAISAILVLPLVAFVIQILIGKRLPRSGDWVSISAIFFSLILSVIHFIDVFRAHDPGLRQTVSWLWLAIPEFSLEFGYYIDNLASLMLLVVTIISFLVQLYSVGYMRNDLRYSRYFAYLSLFSFSMIGLVVVDNLFFLYIFWELVGICSYLLIGFWFEKPAAADASKKAFITTRIGDVGMFVGILLIFFQTNGLLKYEDVFLAASKGLFNSEILGLSVLTLTGICLFLGAVGKSAQFPLHVWLPDAMEGPTPISALIHAATMVAAGVYLVARMFPFLSPEALLVVAYTGGFTAFFSATMALTHTDIKKILAYSTISQLGLMMLGLGVGAYTAGFFHLVTHATFKASLFLCAGGVIHATHSQDIREMGGLRNKMPVTFWASVVATLAISGVPLFSGFVSKDLILSSVYSFAAAHPAHFLLPIFGFGGALLTAFYMFRWMFLIFFGAAMRGSAKKDQVHDSPWTMTLPLVILSLLSFAIVFTGSPLGLGELKLFGSFSQWFTQLIVSPKPEEILHSVQDDSVSHLAPLILSLSVVAIGILLSYLIYFKKVISAEKVSEKFSGVYKTLTNLYWIDELYEWLIIKNQIRLNNVLAHFDNRVIDETLVDPWGPITAKTSLVSGDFDNRAIDQLLVDGTGKVIGRSGIEVRKIQTGKIQQYLLLGLGVACVTLIILVWRLKI